MKLIEKLVLLVVFVGMSASSALAQDDCPALVKKALDLTGKACAAVGRNQVCYGHTTLSVESRSADDTLAFAAPGDLVNVIDLQSLQLGSMDDLFQEWGVALMKLQANLPDTLPGQTATFVLFGSVQITDAAPAATVVPTMQVTALGSANVRSAPSRSGAVVGSLKGGQTVTSNGRNEVGDWLHIQLDKNNSGWVSAPLVQAEDDVSTLNVVASNAVIQPQPAPLQAFYLKTGFGDSKCSQSPDSGILIQTPKGVGSVELTINAVEIILNSTVYVQAEPGKDMVISVVEGQVKASVGLNSVWIPAGTRVRIPLDANGVAVGPPSPPEPYLDLNVLSAPAALLPDHTVALPLTVTELAEYQKGGLFSAEAGNACVGDGVTVSQQLEGVHAGAYTAQFDLHTGAGITATFSLQVNGGQPKPYYLIGTNLLLMEPLLQRIAETKSDSITFTFDHETDFQVWAVGRGGDVVTVTITCQ